MIVVIVMSKSCTCNIHCNNHVSNKFAFTDNKWNEIQFILGKDFWRFSLTEIRSLLSRRVDNRISLTDFLFIFFPPPPPNFTHWLFLYFISFADFFFTISPQIFFFFFKYLFLYFWAALLFKGVRLHQNFFLNIMYYLVTKKLVCIIPKANRAVPYIFL